MGGPVSVTGSTWSGCSSKGSGSESAISPMRFRCLNPLEFAGPASYFVRVSNRPLSRYDYAAWPERTTTKRGDERNGCVNTAGRQEKGAESGHRADREELW